MTEAKIEIKVMLIMIHYFVAWNCKYGYTSSFRFAWFRSLFREFSAWTRLDTTIEPYCTCWYCVWFCRIKKHNYSKIIIEIKKIYVFNKPLIFLQATSSMLQEPSWVATKFPIPRHFLLKLASKENNFIDTFVCQ